MRRRRSPGGVADARGPGQVLVYTRQNAPFRWPGSGIRGIARRGRASSSSRSSIPRSSRFPKSTISDRLLTTQHPERMVFYALMTTLGSVAGCLRSTPSAGGGEAFLRKRFTERHIDRAMETFRRYGLLSSSCRRSCRRRCRSRSSCSRPGVSGMSHVDFLVAVAIGRGIRYFGEGLLALWKGQAARVAARQRRHRGIAAAAARRRRRGDRPWISSAARRAIWKRRPPAV